MNCRYIRSGYLKEQKQDESFQPVEEVLPGQKETYPWESSGFEWLAAMQANARNMCKDQTVTPTTMITVPVQDNRSQLVEAILALLMALSQNQ